MEYIEFPDGTRQANQEMIYAWLQANDSLRNSNPVLDSFYLSHFDGAIGQMNHISELLASLSDSTLMTDTTAWLDALNEARLVNAELTDTNQFIANARWANSRYMDMLEYSVDTLLVGETADSLETLANACPLIAGTAVYRARALLGMLLPGLHYDDLIICNAQGVFKQGQQQEVIPGRQKPADEFLVYPVPASGMLYVRYKLAGLMEILDLLGRTCASYTLNDEGSIALDVSKLPRGVLAYRFLTNDGNVFVGKIILE